MNEFLAQCVKLPGMTTCIQGPLNKGPVKFNTLADLVNNAVYKILIPIAGVLLLGYLIWGGFDYLLSMGDPKRAEAGKTKITQAIIGFFIIFAAYWITQLVAFLFGLSGKPGSAGF